MSNKMPRVQIINPTDGWLGTQCYIDGKRMEKVKSVDFHVGVDEAPAFTFETIGLPDLDVFGEVRLKFVPETAIQAAAILQKEFAESEELRKALIKSIEGVLKELPADKETWNSDVAEKIAKRIVGLD